MDLFSWLEPIFIDYGYVAVFIVLLLCGFGVPIPEDVTLVAGGVIAGLGHANPHIMVVVGLAGVLIGDGVMFLAGRIFGYRILRLKWGARIITRKRYIRVKALFTKYGNWV
ncbi:MAG: DedA family protein, partial [Xanthomonadaceae bacterium]|nr:DedA family protein [Xanthomonadaceae bacterium]